MTNALLKRVEALLTEHVDGDEPVEMCAFAELLADVRDSLGMNFEPSPPEPPADCDPLAGQRADSADLSEV